MNCIVDGLATHYTKSGKGKVLVWIHGWGDSLQTFSELSRLFEPNYTIVRVDLPGFGGSQSPSTPFGLQEYAQFLSAFIIKMQVPVFAVIGHSNGGAIAIKALSNDLISAEKLVLIASSGVRAHGKPRKKALQSVAKVAKVALLAVPKSKRQSIKRRMYRKIGSDLYVAEHLQESFRKVVSEDIVKQSASVKIPTLLIYGSNDTATPPSYGELFSNQMPNAQLAVVAGADHFLHQTHTEQLSDLIDTFLKVAK